MSTPALPDTRDDAHPRSPEVFWAITWEDGTTLDNGEGRTWNEVAFPELVDGLALPRTIQNVARLVLLHPIFDGLDIVPPEPLPFFGFARYAQPLRADLPPVWLYSAFGYVLPTYVYAVKLWAVHAPECLLLPRPMQFPL